MLTAEQIATRKTGFGGSDAAAACGLSRWQTPLGLYLEKRGEVEPNETNDLMDWGNRLEPAIRQAYSDATGRVVRLPRETLRHPRFPFMLCHPDGVTDDFRLFEAKNTRSGEEWGEPGTDQIPAPYLVQVQHNMAVTGLQVADVAVLVGGSDFRLYEVPADDEAQEIIVALEAELWGRIERGDPPPVRTNEDARLRFGRSSIAREVQAGPEALAAFDVLVGLKKHLASVEREIEEAEVVLKSTLGEYDTLVNGRKVLATWKAARPAERLDVAALRAAFPEIAAQFTRTGEPTRRLLLKG
jgi:putative phage-type endonuclease